MFSSLTLWAQTRGWITRFFFLALIFSSVLYFLIQSKVPFEQFCESLQQWLTQRETAANILRDGHPLRRVTVSYWCCSSSAPSAGSSKPELPGQDICSFPTSYFLFHSLLTWTGNSDQGSLTFCFSGQRVRSFSTIRTNSLGLQRTKVCWVKTRGQDIRL